MGRPEKINGQVASSDDFRQLRQFLEKSRHEDLDDLFEDGAFDKDEIVDVLNTNRDSYDMALEANDLVVLAERIG